MARSTTRGGSTEGEGTIDLTDDERPADEHDEQDRGRQAGSPTDIPAKGWKDVLKRTWSERKEDNAQIVSAGVAFYLFLALVPALIAVISVYGLVADPADVEQQISSVTEAMPEDAASLVEDQVENVASSSSAGLGIGLAVSILGALWSASKGMQALITALNIAYNEEESRGFIKLKALAVLMTLGLVVTAGIGVGGMVLVSTLASELGSIAETVINIVRWPLLGLFGMAVVAALYRYAPDRDDAEWRWISPGAILAVVVWLVASLAFSFYANNFGSFNETYGALAGVVLLLLWLFITSFIIVMGAELDSEMERQTYQDTTGGGEEPMGRREARSADTVGARS